MKATLRPMHTAPRDGTPIMLLHYDLSGGVVVSWVGLDGDGAPDNAWYSLDGCREDDVRGEVERCWVELDKEFASLVRKQFRWREIGNPPVA